MQRTNNKSHTIRALMKNEKMAALMRDAVASPLGSTPRKRAQSIVSIMQKVGALDKKVPASVYRAAPKTKSEVRDEQMKKTPIIFTRVEGFRIPSHGRGIEEIEETHDGAGGPGLAIPDQYKGMFAGQTVNPTAYTPTQNTPVITKSIYTGNMGPQPLKIPSGSTPLQAPLSTTKSPLPTAGFLAYQAKTKTPEEEAKYRDVMAKLTTGKMTQSQAYAALGIGAAASFPSTPTKATTPPATQAPASGLASTIANRGQSFYGMTPPKTNTQPTTSQGQSGGASQGQQEVIWPGSEEDTTTSEYNNLLAMLGVSGTDADPYSSITNAKLHDAVTGHMGASAFAYNMMNNAKELRKLPGFENVPDDALPYGASLVGQTNALAETLRKEYKLDALLSQHMSLIEGGTTLQTDLTDYIRGRDEFLNETQGLIDNFKDQMLNGMDMANPVIAQRAEQYGNYLYTLKGRQNKRYIEFLNSSVDMYNNKLAASKDTLTTALDYYERDLKQKTDIATEEFGMYYQMLSDMYTEAAGLPDLELTRAAAKAQIVNTYAQSLADTTESADIDYTKEYSEQLKLLRETAYDKDGNLLPAARNIADLFIKYGGNQVDSYGNPIAGSSPIDPKVIFDAWGSALPNEFSKATNPAEVISNLNTYLEGVNQYSALDPQDPGHQAQSRMLADKVTSQATDSLYRVISEDDTMRSALKDAVAKLTHPSFFSRLTGGYTKEDLKKDYGPILGNQFLDRFYSQFEQYVASGGKENSWHVYAGTGKYPSDPGINNVNENDIVKNVVNLAFSGMRNSYAQ